MELSNIIYKSKEKELSECGGTDLQSQHSGVSAEGEWSEVKTSLGYITRVCLKTKTMGK